MTKYCLSLFFLIFSITFAWAQDYMDDIANKSCQCLDMIPDTLADDQFNLKFGLCMINAATPYKAKMKKDYGVDWNHIETEGGKLGRLIGVKMASVCPGSLVKVSERMNKNKKKAASLEMQGKIVKLETDLFVVFILQNNAGETTKYYWLTEVETDFDLINKYDSVVGKKVNITYDYQRLFDPKLNEYRDFKVIKKLDVTD